MFPEKIRRFVSQLTERTESGELVWRYDYYDAVFCTGPDFSAKLLYAMNARDSCTQFTFFYRDAEDNDYEFIAQSDARDPTDYQLAGQLFDTARASGLALPYSY